MGTVSLTTEDTHTHDDGRVVIVVHVEQVTGLVNGRTIAGRDTNIQVKIDSWVNVI